MITFKVNQDYYLTIFKTNKSVQSSSFGKYDIFFVSFFISTTSNYMNYRNTSNLSNLQDESISVHLKERLYT